MSQSETSMSEDFLPRFFDGIVHLGPLFERSFLYLNPNGYVKFEKGIIHLTESTTKIKKF